MQLIDVDINMDARRDTINLYPIGDTHFGAYNCDEKKVKEHVRRIKEDKDAFWFGGGDLFESIILPDWMLSGMPARIRGKIKDIVQAQLDYGFKILNPIKNKCIGFLMGDQEYTITHCHNRDIMKEICDEFEVPNLTDHAFLRFNCRRMYNGGENCSVIRAYVCHGNGGGRSPGAEPAYLTRMAQERDCELILCGHSHNFLIMPTTQRLTIPKRGIMSEHATTHDIRAANWGSWLLSYGVGPSTDDSGDDYPVRASSSLRVGIKPFKEENDLIHPEISINEIVLS